MNLSLVKIKLIVLLLVMESHGGLIEGVYGRIKNTTTGLRQDVRNAWSYSKGVVGLEDPEEEHKDGLIGGAIHSVKDRVHNFHEQFWVVEEIPNDSGLLWNMYYRFKQRLAKAKAYILGNNVEVKTEAPNEENDLIHETMGKIFNLDGTRKVDDKTFEQIVENLKKQLTEMRNSKTTTETPVNHGEGVIDVRLAEVDKDDDTSVIQSISNDIYDKVDDGMQNFKVKTGKAKEVLNKQLNNGVQSLRDEYDNVSERASDVVLGLNDVAVDAAAKERDLFDATFNKLTQNSKSLSDNLKQSANDAAKLANS